MRIKIFAYILTSFFLLLVLRIFGLQVIQSGSFRELSDRNCIRLLTQPGARGRILDSNGQVIVDNDLVYDVLIVPQDNAQTDRAIAKAASVLGTSAQSLKKNFKAGYIAPSIPVTVAKNIDLVEAITLEELKIEFPSLLIQPRPVRHYPYGKLGCHLIGYLHEIDRWRLTKLSDYGYKTKDIVGYTGLEEKYDYYLREESGATSIEVDHKGKFIRVLGYKPAKNGKDIQLTIDLKIQQIAEDCLGAHKGSIVIMDPFDGKVIALANSPGYRPEVFIKSNDSSLAGIFSDPDSVLMDRAISGAYPPGSIFKLVVATAALETRKINLGTTFTCPGYMMVGKRQFKCWDTHHEEDLQRGIARSCDVFFYHTGLLLGAKNIHDYAVRFGFGRPTSIDLPYEVTGLVPDPLWKKIYRFQGWFDGDTANFSIGQGDLLVTPLQIARMTAVFANDGFLVNPYLLKAVDGQAVGFTQKRPVSLGFKKNTVATIKEGMRMAVAYAGGTAGVLSDLGIAVAGKTGTAQVAKYRPHGWFCGFFPYQQPKFVICTFLENGNTG